MCSFYKQAWGQKGFSKSSSRSLLPGCHPLTWWSEGLRKDNRKEGIVDLQIWHSPCNHLVFVLEKGGFGAIFCSLMKEQWQSGKDNFRIHFHSSVSKKAIVLAHTLHSVPCQPNWDFKHDDSSPLGGKFCQQHTSVPRAWPGSTGNSEGDMMRYSMKRS